MSTFITWQNLIIDHYFIKLGTTLDGDPDLYIGLSTTTPNTDGTNVTEPAASTGYQRLSVGDSSNFTWTIELEGIAPNEVVSARPDQAIVWPAAKEDWGTFSHWFLTTDPAVGGAADRVFYEFNDPNVPIPPGFLIASGGEFTVTVNAGQILTLPMTTGVALQAVRADPTNRRFGTAFVDERLLDSMFNNVAVPVSITWVGIHTTFGGSPPQYTGGFGEPWDIIPSSGYGRVIVSKGDFGFPPTWVKFSQNKVENDFQIIFTTSAPTGWGGTGWFLILDSAGTDPDGAGTGLSGGNLLFWIESPSGVTMASGDRIRFLDGAFNYFFE